MPSTYLTPGEVYYLFLIPSLTPAFNGLCTPFDSTVIGGQKPSREGSRREDAGGSEKVKAPSQGSKVKMREYDLRLMGHDIVVDARVRLVINGS